jgi:hypothetical protein
MHVVQFPAAVDVRVAAGPAGYGHRARKLGLVGAGQVLRAVIDLPDPEIVKCAVTVGSSRVSR